MREKSATLSSVTPASVPPAADLGQADTPAQNIDIAVSTIDRLRKELNAVLGSLPADAPLFAVTDLVVALNHLKRAAVALDKASDAFEADTQAVN